MWNARATQRSTYASAPQCCTNLTLVCALCVAKAWRGRRMVPSDTGVLQLQLLQTSIKYEKRALPTSARQLPSNVGDSGCSMAHLCSTEQRRVREVRVLLSPSSSKDPKTLLSFSRYLFSTSSVLSMGQSTDPTHRRPSSRQTPVLYCNVRFETARASYGRTGQFTCVQVQIARWSACIYHGPCRRRQHGLRCSGRAHSVAQG